MPKGKTALAVKSYSYSMIPTLSDTVSSQANASAVYAIGDLSREFGVTLRALRFYEDKGLLNPTRDGLTRLYSARDRENLQLILKGKRLGFTLVEINDMIANQDGTPKLSMSAETVKEQIAHLERQRGEIDEALVELRKSYESLSRGAR
ncbi:MerR family transcriptional regulator [Labrys wisconsinensis]|uniref:DNA-binding transcriptional MerR regulator n=1 Tax=Labrys wisconsinensis TaxID=425677 RepID=A0ABU0JDK2_9HYPH|nr:MerR family DNA-binding transcriptional regulator [Labrys wisconsinensis]MDQ0472354.1 DNA-binding transcriptional MerR regulator [Labrys wisconsinensis]